MKNRNKRLIIIGIVLGLLIILGVILKWENKLYLLSGAFGAWLLMEIFFFAVYIIADIFTASKLSPPNQKEK